MALNQKLVKKFKDGFKLKKKLFSIDLFRYNNHLRYSVNSFVARTANFMRIDKIIHISEFAYKNSFCACTRFYIISFSFSFIFVCVILFLHRPITSFHLKREQLIKVESERKECAISVCIISEHCILLLHALFHVTLLHYIRAQI